jgi:NDP-sugar pyrophosphorylase family protein
MERKAVILAGGKGTRLKPYTVVFPKPLVPIGEKPILELILRQLSSHGFSDVTFAVNHLAELIRAYFGNGERWAVDISYSLEEKPLGTAGPLGLMKDLDDNFLVMNGDILTNINYSDLWQSHMNSGAIATIATCFKEVPISLGVLDVSADSKLISYTEKPVLKYRVSMGMYVFKKQILDFITPNQYLDLPDLMKTLMASNQTIHCYDFTGQWLDIGNPEDYALANQRFAEDESYFLKSK